jgi:isopenicillin N synthase-like dioxygenase
MECISVGLDLDSQYLPKLCSKADNTLRLLHYPAVEKSKLEVA